MKHQTKIIEAIIENGEHKLDRERIVNSIQSIPDIPSFNLSNLYYLEEMPTSQPGEHVDTAYDINLPDQSMRFLICRIPPIQQVIAELNTPEVTSVEEAKVAGMHKTDTVDFWYVAKGEIILVTENGDESHLKAGDFTVVHGAIHSWVNPSDEYCELVGFMYGVKPEQVE